MELVTSHFGKSYQSEPAVISITSWKARISTVGLTLYSIFKTCPGFHVCLVLSEEEFPKKEAELPKELIMMCKMGLLEVLWVFHNFKVTKKLIPCCVYGNTPIIITDDDVVIVKNFARELYDNWTHNQNSFISYVKSFANPPYINAACGLIPPVVNTHIKEQFILGNMKDYAEDDFLRYYARDAHIEIIGLHDYYPFYFHDESEPLTGSINRPFWITRQRYA